MPLRTRRRLRAGLAIVCCTIATLGALSSCTSDDTAQRPPDRARIAETLQSLGSAVLRHDPAGYLAGFAGAFRDEQQTVFANLEQVPLSRWSYRVGAPVTDADAQRTARRRHGASAVIVKVELRYAIDGVDAAATTRDLWWTVVRRARRPVVVADTDLAAAGGTSWRGPWDFGRLDVVRGRASLVLGHPDDAALNRAVAATLDRAVPAVTRVWGDDWTRRVAAVVPGSSAELTAALGPSAGAGTEVGALAVEDTQDPVSGRPLGQRIVVVPDQLRRLSALGRRIVLQHETTHIATARRTTDATPRWLVEGFAEYVGNLGSEQPVPVAAGELVKQVKRSGLPAALPADADFESPSTAAAAYQSSWLACRFLAARAGQNALVRFYRAVAASPQSNETAVAAALRDIARTTPARFVAGWRAYVQDQLA